MSTLYQVFVSIYGLIFVDEPYFNEPGYQVDRGTPRGDEANAAYNAQQRYKTVELTMLNQLKKPTPEFEDVISCHFTLRKESIIFMVRHWSTLNSEVKGSYKNMSSQVSSLEKILKKM